MSNSISDGSHGAEQSTGWTHEEHKARAALLGLVYHHGNGDGPFYYKLGEDGIPVTESMIDAVTLEPLIIKVYRPDNTPMFTYNTLDSENVNRRHNMMWDTNRPPARIKK